MATEHLDLIVLALGSMFFLMKLSVSLGEKHDPLKFFLMSVAMIMGLWLGHLGVLSAELEHGVVHSEMVNAMVLGFRVWIFTTISFLFYFGVMFFKVSLESFRNNNKLGGWVK